MLTAVLATVSAVPQEQRASLLESVLTVGAFVTVFALIVCVQLWTYRRRRRGDEASSYDGRGAEVMLGNWFT